MRERVPWLAYLVNHIGLREIPGPEHEPLIVEWGREAGIGWWGNDEDAWCAVAVNGALVRSGYPSTRSALARSFTTYGTRLSRPVAGAIVVFPRGPNPLYGHVGIVEEVNDDGTMTVVSGNVGNRVARSLFRVAAVLPDGIRWPPGAVPPEGAGPAEADAPLGGRSLAIGASGPDVKALQRDLNVLNYGLAVDGRFGGRTRDAVVRFQARRGLAADGVADAEMLSALEVAVAARARRNERRESAGRAAAPVAGAAVAVGATVSTVAEAAREVRSLHDGTLLGAGLAVVVVVAVVGVLVWRFALGRAEGPRAEDAE